MSIISLIIVTFKPVSHKKPSRFSSFWSQKTISANIFIGNFKSFGDFRLIAVSHCLL